MEDEAEEVEMGTGTGCSSGSSSGIGSSDTDIWSHDPEDADDNGLAVDEVTVVVERAIGWLIGLGGRGTTVTVLELVVLLAVLSALGCWCCCLALGCWLCGLLLLPPRGRAIGGGGDVGTNDERFDTQRAETASTAS